MDSVIDLLGAVESGVITAEDAGPKIARLIREEIEEEEAETAGMGWFEITSRRMAGSLADRADFNTFTKVEAAHYEGRITDEQYSVIRAAVEGRGR